MELKLNNAKLKLRVNGAKFFQNVFDFNLGSAITEVIDVESNAENIIYGLLFEVARETNVTLAKELDQYKLNNADNLTIIYDQLEIEWNDFITHELTITQNFFNNVIQDSPDYLIKSYLLFQKYIRVLKIDIPDNFHFRYYAAFRQNLEKEIGGNLERYKKIIESLVNPVSQPNSDFDIQLRHYSEISEIFTSKLQSGVDESTETLKDLYVAPFFQIHKRNFQNIVGKDDFYFPEIKTDINSFLLDFVLKINLTTELRSQYNMIFILGQPGQGKTSLCYKLIYDILHESHGIPEIPFFFIKIRDLHAKDFVEDTFNTLKKAIQQNIDFESDKCLLVLDGLDEAYMSGGLADSDLKNLYERLNKTSRKNQNLKIILTSRLNYLSVNDPSVQGSLVIRMEVFEKNQIVEYLQKFKKFYSENNLVSKIDNILEDERFTHVTELLAQPVLMYFIALTNIDIDRNDSKALIYNKIFESLAKRSWDKNGQLDHINPDLKANPTKFGKYLRHYIRNIAFEIYQSPNLHITVNKLIALDASKEFIRKCFNEEVTNNQEVVRNISKYLLISFYFQSSKSNQDGDAAIEFFHNSLWEYLTAEYIWEESKNNFLKHDDDGDLQSLNINEYHGHIKRMIGNKQLKSEVRKNLENIIIIEKEDIRDKMFIQTKDVFYKLLDKEMLLNYDSKNEKLNVKEKMHNMFELAWTMLIWTNKAPNILLTNDSLNEFFFDYRSSFNYDYHLKNIRFSGSYFNKQYLTECLLENIYFDHDGIVESLNLNDNEIINCVFHRYFSLGDIDDNIFSNVIFDQIKLYQGFRIRDNEFKNCEFRNVSVPDENTLKDIIASNKVDDEFIKNHSIIKKISPENEDLYYIICSETNNR